MKVGATAFVAVAILAGFAMSQSAEARRVQLQKHYSKAQIKAACDAAGGEESIEGSTYGCEVPSNGTSVYCNSKECWGYVPDSSKIGTTGLATANVPISDVLKGQ